MKSPEEIRKGLAYCDSRDHMHNGCAGGCPYWCDKYGCHSTEMKIDALGYIQQLEERVAELDKLASSRLRRMKLFRERANKYIKECLQLRRRVEKLENQIADTGKMEPLIRRTDDLGRVAIPKETRARLGIHPGDALEIEMDGPSGAIVMRKRV